MRGCDNNRREEALTSLENDMMANSSRDAIEHKVKLFCDLHVEWFGPKKLPLPVTPAGIKAVAAM